MNIIIPLGGKGQRFADIGHKLPKPLIRLFFKPIILWLLDNLSITERDNVYLICNRSLKKYRFEDEIKKKYSNYNIIYLDEDTRGAAETIYAGTKNITSDEETILLDGDTFYGIDLLEIYRTSKQKNMVVCFKQSDNRPIYSYVKFDENKIINKITEKKKITEFANTGAYAFEKLSELRSYCKTIIDNSLKLDGELYTSHVIAEMIKDKKQFVASIITESDFEVIGTPFQYKLFQNKFLQSKNLNYFNKYRICFDLDNTLVTYPKIKTDYTTVEPVNENIEFVKFLKKLGCTIIIYTARRMMTHAGNVGKIMQDVGKITIDTLDRFEIPYDELYFGKPYAHAYIDDLAINAFDDYQMDIGVSNFLIDERDFNELQDDVLHIITKKSSSTEKLKGEISWYNNMPTSFRRHVPALISYDDKDFKQYQIERVQGLTFQELFLSGNLTRKIFNELLSVLQTMHKCRPNTEVNIYQNYATKLEDRYRSYNYTQFKDSNNMYQHLKTQLNEYENKQKGQCGIIHGDPVFTNILFDRFDKIKLIDPRGILGDEVTIYGDIYYDYAKIYQSLIGYDEVMQNCKVDLTYKNMLIEIFFEHISKLYGGDKVENIKIITNSLLFTLLPLHDNNKCKDYYKLIK